MLPEDGGKTVRAGAAPYLRDPEAIYRQSFETIRREADLSRFRGDAEAVAVRMIHACGMTDLTGDLVISDGVVEAGRSAMARRRPVICDVDMVCRGVIRRLLPEAVPVVSRVGGEEAASHARTVGTTRSAAALDLMASDLPEAIVAIGNAPTALFHLLEMLDAGLKPPALIIGVPVGFVGAVESKEALLSGSHGVPFITVRGRRGGSALAAAAVNAIAGGLAR